MSVNEKMTALADAIRAKTGDSEKLTLDGMALAIGSIETGGAELPEEAFTVTGDCTYRFANGGWTWFIDNYGDKVITKDITNASNMFYYSKGLKEIPFEINFSTTDGVICSNLFNNCENLTSIPKINNAKVSKMKSIFENCQKLRELPEDIGDWFDWSYMENQTSAYGSEKSNMLSHCYSLRSVPISLFSRDNPIVSYSSAQYYSTFHSCYVLDEIVNLPIPYTATWTGNAFTNSFNSCSRLKNLTFAMPDGQPYIMNWKSQVIDLSKCVGYAEYRWYVLGNNSVLDINSGITEDKEIKDDDTYAALKDDPDCFTTVVRYSRYNHDSAVATINSLPDTSAYLSTAGGTNTIKFLGASGSATDGGAISNLTEAEIAVAAARGWSVALV